MSDSDKKQDQEKGDEVLRRLLKTPPKPNLRATSMARQCRADAEYLVIDGKMLVANIKERKGRSITADIFRNLDDFCVGAAMERSVLLEEV